jgi:predicted transcriptional regulator
VSEWDDFTSTVFDYFGIATHRHEDTMATIADIQAKITEIDMALTSVAAGIKEIKDGSSAEHDKVVAALDEALVKIKAFVTPHA